MTGRLTRTLPTLALAATLLAWGGHARAAGAGTAGCPQFHCTPEATGVMAQPIVAPTLDEVAGTVCFPYTGRSGNNEVYAHNLFDGTPRANSPFTVQARASQVLPRNFVLKSHLGAIQAGGSFTLLLSGSSRAAGGNPAGQYMIGFQPLSGAIWARQIDSQGARGTAAWNLSPTNSGNPSLHCPVLVATEGSIGDDLARACD